MKNNKVFKVFLVLAIAVIMVAVIPLTSSADDYSQYMPSFCPQAGTAAADSEFYYYDGTNHFVVDNNMWKAVDYTEDAGSSEDVYLTLAHDIRTAMLNRQNTISFCFATYRDENNQEFINNLNKRIGDRYLDTYDLDVALKAKGGDYLKQNLITDEASNELTQLGASSFSPYNYYNVTMTYHYRSTAAEEQLVDAFLSKWQKTFIEDNIVIQNASTINEKNYYIVKTIYNFLSINTLYDNEVYYNQFSQDSERYRFSHTAAGALMQIAGSESYNWNTYTDSQGLTRISQREQGMSVCDGYAELAYYLCQLNAIDCRIVIGDYDTSSGNKVSDPHAWNIVKLCPSDSDVYQDDTAQWYNFDATFAATSQTSVKADYPDDMQGEVIFVDYSFFLRGSQNRYFASDLHQSIPAYQGQSAADYELKSAVIDSSKSWIVLVRRMDTSNFNEIENYVLISPEGRHYQLEEYITGRYRLVSCGDKITYSGDEFYYNINIQDCANGVEYLCSEQAIIDSGKYPFNALSVDGSRELASFEVTIASLRMNDWSSYSSFIWNGTDIKDIDQNAKQTIKFVGAKLNFTTDITDCAGKHLTEGEDYTVKCVYRGTDTEVIPFDPGQYSVSINFDGLKEKSNYSGNLLVHFDIVKNEMYNIPEPKQGSNDIVYGDTNVANNYRIISFDGSDIQLVEGVDYSIMVNNDSKLPVGATGSVTLTALEGSKYIVAGTSVQYHYTITQARDLSSLSGGGFNRYEPYLYTGSPILLTSSQINLSNGDILVQGKDYDIISYSNNINVGTAYAKITLKGNYCGTIDVAFNIYPNNSSSPQGGTDSNQNNSNQNITNDSNSNPNAGNTSSSVSLSAKKVSGLKAVYSSNSVNISWNGQGDYINYELQMYDSKSKVWRTLAQFGQTSFKSNYPVVGNKKGKFAVSQQYKYRVRAFYIVTINGEEFRDYSAYTAVTVNVPVKVPAKPKATAAKGSLTVKWSSVSKAAGYEILYSTNKNFKKGNKTVKIKNAKTKSKKIKGLKSKATYYVKIRAYSKIGGKTVYSPYSKVVKVKIK